MSQIRGFTLIELLVAIAVMAILLTVGVPGFSLYLLSSQRAAASTQLYAALSQARSEAIAYNSEVSVCARAGGDTPACAGDDADWNLGWLVVRSSDDRLLASYDAVGDGIAVAPATATNRVRFRASGRTSATACFSVAANSSSLKPREVRTLPSGRISLSETDAPCA